MIRATTGGVLKTYRSNLMNSFISQSKAMNTILTQRTFNSFAEDPASAAKAFRLRKSRMTVSSQSDICADTLKKYETGFSCLQSIDEVLDTQGAIDGSFMQTLHGATESWLNDPTGDAREQLAKAFSQMSEQLIQTMNQKYGDNFIFAGADGHNVPFEIVDGQLNYRGIPVDSHIPDVMTDPASLDADGNPKPMEIDSTTGIFTQGGGSYVKMDPSALIKQTDYDDIGVDDPTAVKPKILYTDPLPPAGNGVPTFFTEDGEVIADPATYTGDMYYLKLDEAETMTTKEYDTQKLNAEKLAYLADETYYVDIGLGFQENEKGSLIPSSGFNAALNGINFLGYGVDEDGDPKNIYSLVQKLREISDSVPENGTWSSVWPEFNRLVGKLETACSDFKTEFTNMAASTTKLKNQDKLLEDNYYNLVDQYSELEDVDTVDAISAFLWAQYSYNAALKVGNSVLSQSLMDYLN